MYKEIVSGHIKKKISQIEDLELNMDSFVVHSSTYQSNNHVVYWQNIAAAQHLHFVR